MAKIIPFPEPKGVHAVSLDLFLEPDGSILARVADMSPRTIESLAGEPWEKMLKLALWTQQASDSLAQQSNALRPDDDVS